MRLDDVLRVEDIPGDLVKFYEVPEDEGTTLLVTLDAFVALTIALEKERQRREQRGARLAMLCAALGVLVPHVVMALMRGWG